jgi:hypothetical protein
MSRPSNFRDPTSRHADERWLDRALNELHPCDREILLAYVGGASRTQLSLAITATREVDQRLDMVLGTILQQLRTSSAVEGLREDYAAEHGPRHSLMMRAAMEAQDRVPRCAHCRKPMLEPTATGRPRRYCGNACKQAAYRIRKTAPSGSAPPPGENLFPVRDLFAAAWALPKAGDVPLADPELMREARQRWRERHLTFRRYGTAGLVREQDADRREGMQAMRRMASGRNRVGGAPR